MFTKNLNESHYYPFGMGMNGRKYSAANGYRYGFNGKENDNEVKGEGNQYDYGFRIYDPRIGRFLSVDPLTNKYPELSTYQFASNMPIVAIDEDGKEAQISIIYHGTKEQVLWTHDAGIFKYAPSIVHINIHKYYGLNSNNKWTLLRTTVELKIASQGVDSQTGRIDLQNHSIGKLSEVYESSGRGPGLVSSGNGDPGGVSYGVYQLASKTGTLQDFMDNEGSKWATEFKGLTPGTAAFSVKWKEIAKSVPDEMRTTQHNYIYRTHYETAKSKIEKTLGIDIDSYSNVMKDVIWSTAVQHGPKNNVVINALKGKDVKSMSESDIITAIYNERSTVRQDGKLKYFVKASKSQKWKEGLIDRFKKEKEAALNQLPTK